MSQTLKSFWNLFNEYLGGYYQIYGLSGQYFKTANVSLN